MKESDCVSVPRGLAEKARRLLLSRGLLKRLRPKRVDDRILWPVKDAALALEVLSSAGVSAEPCREVFEPYPEHPTPLSTIIKSYIVIGDIALFSYHSGVSMEEYKKAAFQLLKRGNVRAVFLKIATKGDRRTPELVRLAGSEGSTTVAKEYGLRFLVDVGRVYYNPRLANERRRVAASSSDGEIVLDMFAGVGPYSIHMASLRRVTVLSVDINPVAVDLMRKNIVMNIRKLRGCIVPILGDSSNLPAVFKPVFDRIIMNNPTMSDRFMEAACSLARKQAKIHYYRLSRSCEEAWREVNTRVEPVGCELNLLGCRKVLDYSPSHSIYSLDIEVVEKRDELK